MLVEVPFSYVYPYARIAAREHVSVSPTQLSSGGSKGATQGRNWQPGWC